MKALVSLRHTLLATLFLLVACAVAFAVVAPPVIVSPPEGAFVRGTIAVVATPTADSAPSTATGEATAVARLDVDGSLVATRPGIPWRFALDTRRLRAGTHLLAVRSVTPAESAEATRSIVVDNEAPRLRSLTPAVRVATPATEPATLKWALSDVATTPAGISIRVTNARSVVRRGAWRTWAMPRIRKVAWTWDGRDHRGALVPRGVYAVSVSVTDAAGNVRTAAATSTVVVGGWVVCIDAGHQGRADLTLESIGPGSKVRKPKVAGGATGAVSHIPESRITLAVALRLEKLLKARGFTVVMVRRTQDVNVANSERARIANRAHADLFVRIHLDGVANSAITGTSMQHPGVNKWTKPIAARSRAAAVIVERELVKSLRLPDRGLFARGDMTGFNWCTVPVVLPELAFLSNPRDDRLMSSSKGQAKAALGLANGISAVFAR